MTLPSTIKAALVALLALGLGACAYPRRTTPLLPVTTNDAVGAPNELWRLEFVSGTVGERQRSGVPWDEEDRGGPDPVVRLYRNDGLAFESPVARDTRHPEWRAITPNLRLPRSAQLRFEVWDDDRVGHQPIGQWEQHGLPHDLLPDAERTLQLDGPDNTLTIRLLRPLPHRGVGVRQYEVRSDALIVLDVIARSPAGRAGLARGDRIIAIGGETVAHLGEARAASALALAIDRDQKLSVVKVNGSRAEIELDHGYVWLEERESAAAAE